MPSSIINCTFQPFGVVLNRTCPCLINISRPTLERSHDKREWMEWVKEVEMQKDALLLERKNERERGGLYVYVRKWKERRIDEKAVNVSINLRISTKTELLLFLASYFSSENLQRSSSTSLHSYRLYSIII